MLTGDELYINGPNYIIYLPNGEEFKLGCLLIRGKTYSKTYGFHAVNNDIFVFENMPPVFQNLEPSDYYNYRGFIEESIIESCCRIICNYI